MPIERLPTGFPEAAILVPEVFPDERGFFKEVYSTAKYRAAGITDDFVQDSVSMSKRGVLRGMHFDPRMSKLVQVLRGAIYDVIVDVRRDSPDFGKWEGYELSAVNHRQLYVPRGFAHGFLALTDDVVLAYKHGALFDPRHDGAVRWDDPAIGIRWPLESEPILSARDRAAPLLSEIAT